MSVLLPLASANLAVGVGGYIGAGAFAVTIPRLDIGNGDRNGGVVTLSFGLVKTGGGTINPATESLTILRSEDGVNFCDLYEANDDSAPANFLAGQIGKSVVAKSLEIRAKPGQVFKAKLAGDGVDDTYTIQHMTLRV